MRTIIKEQPLFYLVTLSMRTELIRYLVLTYSCRYKLFSICESNWTRLELPRQYCIINGSVRVFSMWDGCFHSTILWKGIPSAKGIIQEYKELWRINSRYNQIYFWNQLPWKQFIPAIFFSKHPGRNLKCCHHGESYSSNKTYVQALSSNHQTHSAKLHWRISDIGDWNSKNSHRDPFNSYSLSTLQHQIFSQVIIEHADTLKWMYSKFEM